MRGGEGVLSQGGHISIKLSLGGAEALGMDGTSLTEAGKQYEKRWRMKKKAERSVSSPPGGAVGLSKLGCRV